MRRILALMTVLMLLLPCAASADTMFCPYCGTKVDTAYSFCPSCGKSLSGVAGSPGGQSEGRGPAGGTADYNVTNLPGFQHTLPELISIADSLYEYGLRNSSQYVVETAYTAGTFPMRFSVDWKSANVIASMNLPYMRYDPVLGNYTNLDAEHGYFVEQGKPLKSNSYISYSYTPSNLSYYTWSESISVSLKRGWGVDLIVVNAATPFNSKTYQVYEVSLYSGGTVVSYYLNVNGKIMLNKIIHIDR